MKTITLDELRERMRKEVGLPDQSHLPFNQREYVKSYKGNLYRESEWSQIITSWNGKISLDEHIGKYKLIR
jgi:hypothetical protein